MLARRLPTLRRPNLARLRAARQHRYPACGRSDHRHEPGGAKEWLKEFDNYQIFRLQTASNLYQKATELANSGTALYEKLILLDGATIALSITFSISDAA